MNYGFLLSESNWSYSKIQTYNDCPYKFYLKYIALEGEKKNMFFSSYGSFMHEILQKLFNGEFARDDAVMYYLCNFYSKVEHDAPNEKLFTTYFNRGLEYLKGYTQPFGTDEEVVDTEKRVQFDIGGYKFVGIVDAILRNANGISIWDHKSKDLRQTHKKNTKANAELDAYLRQLYFYTIPVEKLYKSCINELVFNCFRVNIQIKSTFCDAKLQESKQWAVDTIEKILLEDDWQPKLDFFYCRYLCEIHDACDYYQMSGGSTV